MPRSATEVRVQAADFDVGREIAELRRGNPRIGAIATFIGLVRDLNDGASVSQMQLEHYPGMTERALEGIVAQARERWDLYEVRVIHRIGALSPCDQIVLVAVGSAHRGEAFAACEFIMDYLKTRAPFWKKERTGAGERWVEARESDDAAAARWGGADRPNAAADDEAAAADLVAGPAGTRPPGPRRAGR